MSYLALKYLHLLSMVVLFGTGLGSAWYKWMADRGGKLAQICETNRLVVKADWLFTTPTILIQPVTGMLMAARAGLPLDTPWIALSLILYALAGACWLPVVALQIRMHRLSRQALDSARPLPPLYHRQARLWFWLGVPAFLAMTAVVFLMVFKPAWTMP